MEKKYYKDLNILRLVACISVFLYHLNILKGGYLSVIVFFVLSGYLSSNSIFNDNFSLKKYYLNKLLHLYLPLIFVVFISISAISFIESINWMNLKPETTSVILGYNNFWQLNANLDYFTRHVDSPFMHLWYIAILLQYDLIIPFICLGLKKIKDKISKLLPLILTIILSLGSIFYFYILCNQNIMSAYYNTFSRVFALLFGLSLGIYKKCYDNLIPNFLEGKIISKIITLFYLIGLVLLMVFFDTNEYFYLTMILTTFISIRLISYLTINTNDMNKLEKVIKYIVSISYEIYLVQYPLIFIFQEIELDNYIKILLIVLLTILISIILHICLNIKKEEKNKILKYLLRIIVLLITIFGIYKYIIAKDYTKEMKELEDLLNQNQEIMEQNNLEYEISLKEEKENYKKLLEEFDENEEKLKEYVTNLPIVGLGDSVLLGTVPALKKRFPNGYFEGVISSTCYEALPKLKSLKKQNKLGNPIIFNYGANGDCSNACKDQILDVIGDRTLYWINTTNKKLLWFNEKIVNYSKEHPNIKVVDWYSVSKGHSEYFYKDGIHMRSNGRIPFIDLIYNEIYNDYLEELKSKKQQLIDEYDKELKTKFTFYSNDLLLNSIENLKENFKNSNFVIDNFNIKSLKEKINKDIENEVLNYNVVLAFDSKFKLNNNDYEEIINLFKNNKVYIINVQNISINLENIEVIDFYKELKQNRNYLIADKIHLTKEGNDALSNIINSFQIENKGL